MHVGGDRRRQGRRGRGPQEERGRNDERDVDSRPDKNLGIVPSSIGSNAGKASSVSRRRRKVLLNRSAAKPIHDRDAQTASREPARRRCDRVRVRRVRGAFRIAGRPLREGSPRAESRRARAYPSGSCGNVTIAARARSRPGPLGVDETQRRPRRVMVRQPPG